MGNNMTSTEHSRNVPQLRFPEFEGEWVEKKLGEIAERSPHKYNPEKSNKIYNCIELESIEQNTGKLIKLFKSNELKSIKNKFNVGEILFGKLRPYLKKFYFTEFDGVCSSEIWVLKSKKTNNRFLYYLIQTIKFNYQVNLTIGSKMPRADWNIIHNSQFIIPNLFPEQTKIATFLTVVDKRINLLQKKRAELSQYKKGVMQKLFSHELRFKKDDGSDFPDWEEKKLGSVTDIIKGKQLNKSELTEIGTYPAINGGIEPSGYADEWNTIENTITISEGGNSCGYVNYIKTKFWSGGHCYSLLNLKESIDNTFLYQSLKYYQNRIMRLRVGSGLPNIQKGDIHNFKLPFPKKEEQQKIANFLSSLDKSIEKVEKQIEASQVWKKGLLQKMFV